MKHQMQKIKIQNMCSILQKIFLERYPWNSEFQNSEHEVHQVGQQKTRQSGLNSSIYLLNNLKMRIS
jgi:hypothetical protein